MTRLFCIAAIVLCAAAIAGADEEDEPAATSPAQAQAREKFAEGNRKYALGDYAGAEEAFKAASELDPDLPGPYRNLGLVYVATHKCEAAITRFEAYLKLRPHSKHAARITQEIERCKLGLGRSSAGAASELALVTITATTQDHHPLDGAVVKVDGLIRGGAPLDLQITPGRHTIRVERIGYDAGEEVVEVKANATQEIEIPLARQAGGPDVAVQQKRAGRPTRRPIAWALLGVAGVALGAGAAFGILESANWRDATDLDRMAHPRADLAAYQDRGRVYGALAYTGISVGAAALIAASIVFILDPARGDGHGEPTVARAKARALTVAPALLPGGGGLAAGGVF